VTVNVAGSAALALALGLRHGLDADHLAAIDGLTRFNMIRRREFAPYCGALFSAGHGGAIVLAATLLAGLASAWTPPVWLEWTGKFFSAATLLLLGVSNFRLAVSPRSAPQLLPVTGLRGGVFGVTLRSSRAWQIMLVGALFAVSFDALGLAALPWRLRWHSPSLPEWSSRMRAMARGWHISREGPIRPTNRPHAQ